MVLTLRYISTKFNVFIHDGSMIIDLCLKINDDDDDDFSGCLQLLEVSGFLF